MATLRHENVIDIIDYFKEDDHTYVIVMELLKGENLEDFIKSHGGISKELAFDLMTKILEAFVYAHGKGLVHRDIKPSNIYVTPE